MKNVRLGHETHRYSSRKLKLKQSSHLPQMSENALKRWYQARDAYLSVQHSHIKKHRQIKPKSRTIKTHEQPASIVTIEPNQSLEQPQEESQIIHEHVDECIGTDTNESILFETNIGQTDEATQADLPSPENTNIVEDEKNEQIQSDQEPIEFDDKATETDLVFDIKKEDEVDRQSIKEDEVDRQNIKEDEIDRQSIKEETVIEPIPDVSHQIEPPINNDDDTKTILSSSESSSSISEQFRRLRHRFKRLSKERRLLIFLLILYIFIMFCLLVVIFIILWSYKGRSLTLNRDMKMSNIDIMDGIARYGESCKNDKDCKRPFTCFMRRSSSGICRCPLRYDFVNNQCIGDLNALCKKDTDCQRYMLCSGMDDGTRRCHCQTLYNYDNDRKQCRGDYHAPCRSHIDCRANLICNTTNNSSPLCSCQSNYRYYPLVQKCRGDPGAVCEETTAECADNAECRDGACECAFQFIPNEKKICVDPCPKVALKNRVKIRYPGNCRRFIDCQQRSKYECPDTTIFNFRTQLCDYPKNVLDCR